MGGLRPLLSEGVDAALLALGVEEDAHQYARLRGGKAGEEAKAPLAPVSREDGRSRGRRLGSQADYGRRGGVSKAARTARVRYSTTARWPVAWRARRIRVGRIRARCIGAGRAGGAGARGAEDTGTKGAAGTG